MNKTLKLLIFSDIFVLTGFALISPILAIFIKENIFGGGIANVGIAAAITTGLRCLMQLIFAYIAKPKHRYLMVILGTAFIAVVPFIYLFSSNITHIYVAAIVHGFGAGLANPAWFSLFANNLSKGKKGLEWSVYSSSVGIGTAVAAFFGSQAASKFGFRPVFIIVGILAIIGCLILLGLTKKDLERGIIKSRMKVVTAKMKFQRHPFSHS